MPEEKKAPLEGLRKFLFGVALVVAGVWLSLTGNADLGKYLIGLGIAIVVGGNILDKKHEKNKNKKT